MSITLGRYRHYKGADYQVIDTVTHSETEETLVLYRPLYGEGKLWVRPIAMFKELVSIDGEPVPRFELIEPS
ncbi:DUF1653 domain-containing protein [Alginatibacterium sediminis]|uniref:DUF1653 domain-containing protein n=1 Tax=Alginatibacterium sediminis TaxID=2164068 RepID=A0A420E646_9ALTE|nr:DUF1653 domain-containing protein [Alginatibacterium sediminis]RKF13127.1 DUF1653 domain-containing protein [Alginatibacterium sediminis]